MLAQSVFVAEASIAKDLVVGPLGNFPCVSGDGDSFLVFRVLPDVMVSSVSYQEKPSVA
jgi:hypothetical protein